MRTPSQQRWILVGVAISIAAGIWTSRWAGTENGSLWIGPLVRESCDRVTLARCEALPWSELPYGLATLLFALGAGIGGVLSSLVALGLAWRRTAHQRYPVALAAAIVFGTTALAMVGFEICAVTQLARMAPGSSALVALAGALCGCALMLSSVYALRRAAREALPPVARALRRRSSVR